MLRRRSYKGHARHSEQCSGQVAGVSAKTLIGYGIENRHPSPPASASSTCSTIAESGTSSTPPVAAVILLKLAMAALWKFKD